MVKKIIFYSLFFSFLILAPLSVLAQDSAVVSSGESEANQENLPPAGLTPDSPFYFLDEWGEKISLFFTFSPEKKVEKALSYAEEKLAEAQVMAEKNKTRAIERLTERYREYLSEAENRINKIEEKNQKREKVAQRVAEATGKHLEVLERVIEKAPEKAREGLLKAKDASLNGQQVALRVLARFNPERAFRINLKSTQKRLERVKNKIQEGTSEETEELLSEFEKQNQFGEEISRIAQEVGKSTTTVQELIKKATSIHLEVLKTVYEKAPEEAKSALEKAMTNSVENYNKMMEVMKENKEELKEEIEEVPGLENFPFRLKERIREQVREEIKEGEGDKDESGYQDNKKDVVCAQVITPAKNPSTGECKEFSTPCEVPSGWVKVNTCEKETEQEKEGEAEKETDSENNFLKKIKGKFEVQ